MAEIEEITSSSVATTTFKLPLSKIKKIAKLHPNCNMVNADATQALTLACETFIAVFAKEAYRQAQSNKRKTVQRRDIDYCVRNVPWLEFLDGMLDDWPDFSSKGRSTAQVEDSQQQSGEVGDGDEVQVLEDDNQEEDALEEAEGAFEEAENALEETEEAGDALEETEDVNLNQQLSKNGQDTEDGAEKGDQNMQMETNQDEQSEQSAGVENAESQQVDALADTMVGSSPLLDIMQISDLNMQMQMSPLQLQDTCDMAE